MPNVIILFSFYQDVEPDLASIAHRNLHHFLMMVVEELTIINAKIKITSLVQ
jgi:hypothetical protein